MAIIDVRVFEGLALPYVPGAESGLLDESLSPLFDAAWQEFVATFPGMTLMPLFDSLSVEQLEDMLDGIRVNGDEPPNPFVWFTLACDPVVAARISYGANPDTEDTLQIQPSPNGIDAIYAWDVSGGAGDGVRVADLEHGWRLDHDELIVADIHELSVFGADKVDHGTAVAGIVVGSDNGVGTIGIAP